MRRRDFIGIAAASGASAQILQPILSGGGALTPRVMILSDSILDSANLVTRIKTAFPSALVARYTYGGSRTVIGFAAVGQSAQVWSQAGNLLPNSSLAAWTPINVTVADATSPVSGLAVKRLTTNTTTGARIQTLNTSSTDLVVPAGAPQLAYCMMLEPGTHTLCRLQLYNATTSGTIINCDVDLSLMGGFPVPVVLYAKSTDGVGYAAGNAVRPYLYVGNAGAGAAGYLYASNPMVCAGPPTVYHATSGTADAPSAAGWQTPYSTVRTNYDLVVVCFGRNDTNSYTAAEYGTALGALLDQAAKFADRVLVVTTPPKAVADRTAWDDTDTFSSGGFLAQAQSVAAAHGATLYNAWGHFKALVAGGSYAITDLLKDTVHPTDTDVNSVGMGQYVNAITGAMRRGRRPLDLGSSSTVYIGAEPVSGTWEWKVNGATGRYDAHGLLIGHRSGITHSFSCATVGAQVRWTGVMGTSIGILHLLDSDTPCVLDVSIDGGAAFQFGSTSTSQNLPWGTKLATGLSAGPHTVTATVVSGTAKIVGLVAMP